MSKTGIEHIAEERNRQLEKEGWTPEHDNQWKHGELAIAGACYAIEAINKTLTKPILRVQVHLEAELGFYVNSGDRGDRSLRKAGWYDAFPFDPSWDKRSKHDRMRCLEIAGAFISAEIDRINNSKK